MSSPDVLGARFTDRRQKLDETTKEVVSGAPEAGRALALAGDMLRRTQALGDVSMNIERALGMVDEKAILAFVDAIDIAAEHGKLVKAFDDAFEAILEDGEERILYLQSAETALFDRDSLASVRAALAFKKLDTAALDQKLARIDSGLMKKARVLAALNASRRNELAALDSGERASAWWFAARANCDFLVSLYRAESEGGGAVTKKHEAAHLAICTDCQRDVEASSIGYTPEHIASSSLWRREHDQATPAEIAWMDAHAKDCAACKRALEAVNIAEE